MTPDLNEGNNTSPEAHRRQQGDESFETTYDVPSGLTPSIFRPNAHCRALRVRAFLL
jgi:hypothetical protein